MIIADGEGDYTRLLGAGLWEVADDLVRLLNHLDWDAVSVEVGAEVALTARPLRFGSATGSVRRP